ncbi:No apical meristem (NAM) protein [Corchorus olitorius]|uniref:No apical meristem (NAM) protein n=1 Tax=Corchorus olitorius TaxID=93759 RepID=A0A1R3JM23_9ROSI|nr:No apical meristem (NAM) protein [Corchorus olitorius]
MKKKIKGFRFRPTDEELIEYLQDQTFDRDSLVQVIALVQDINLLDPWQLPGRSILQTGDNLWYFMYHPKYKYRNSKRISRTTPQGYWKPTGNARKIINSRTAHPIGTKKTLVFYKGHFSDKDKNKTCWVMHEYQLILPAHIAASVSHQKIFNLCKLKKKIDISSCEAGQSSQHALSNLELENHVVNNAIAIPENLVDPNKSSEPEASNYDCHGFISQSSSIETYAGERSNQHNMVNESEGTNISFNSVNHVAEDSIPQDLLHLEDVSTKRNGFDDSNRVRVQNLYSKIEQDNESCNSILTNDDESFPTERSNQHNNIVVATEGFKMPCSLELEYLGHEDLIPTDLLYNDGLSLDELLAESEATNNFNWIQNQFVTRAEDGELLNSVTANTNEAYLQEGSNQHYLAADNGSSLPCIVMMETSNPMGKFEKKASS